MKILVDKSIVSGNVRAPSSKSNTIRGLICAALSQGLSEIWYPLDSDDTEAAAGVLNRLGTGIRREKNVWLISGNKFRQPSGDLYCGDSAATLRFMSAVCAVVPGSSRLTAGASLSRRPLRVLVEALNRWGIDIECEGEYAPVTVNGGLPFGGHTELPGDVSSQYISALLFIAPLAQNGARLWLTTKLESKPYIRMTLDCQEKFGINIVHSGELMEFEAKYQKYDAAVYKVEGDWSSGSYLLGLGAVGGALSVGNLDSKSLQGDRIIAGFLFQMGASIESKGGSIEVQREPLKAIKADLNDCIDLLPTLAVLAALAQGTSELTGIRRARLKESDRITTVRQNLERAGIGVKEEEDSLIIEGGRPHPAVIDSAGDHRIAMAFSLMGVAAGGITIDGAECVSKTYPEYWNVLRSLGVEWHEQ